MIKVVTNSLGSGDWITVQGHSNSQLFSGHRMTAQDVVDLLNLVGVDATLVQVTDEEMEEGEIQ